MGKKGKTSPPGDPTARGGWRRSSKESRSPSPTASESAGDDNELAPARDRYFRRSETFDEVTAAIKTHNFKPRVANELQRKLTSTLGDIVSREKQLQDIGGSSGKLSMRFKQEWQESEAALAMIPFEAVDVAHRHDDLFANNYHDPLTLLKSRQFYGRLLQLIAGTCTTLLWGSADLDYFKTVNDYWSHAHGDFAIIRTARVIADVVDEWNAKKEVRALCVPFRMGGDEYAPARAELAISCSRARSLLTMGLTLRTTPQVCVRLPRARGRATRRDARVGAHVHGARARARHQDAARPFRLWHAHSIA
jgi:GGDEF domain-containing protein